MGASTLSWWADLSRDKSVARCRFRPSETMLADLQKDSLSPVMVCHGQKLLPASQPSDVWHLATNSCFEPLDSSNEAAHSRLLWCWWHRRFASWRQNYHCDIWCFVCSYLVQWHSAVFSTIQGMLLYFILCIMYIILCTVCHTTYYVCI